MNAGVTKNPQKTKPKMLLRIIQLLILIQGGEDYGLRVCKGFIVADKDVRPFLDA